MMGDSENADSSSLRVERGSEFAREILSALATGDEEVVRQTITAAVAAALTEPELLGFILVAQATLARAALLGGVAENLGPDISGEEFDREFWGRLEALFAVVKRLGSTSG